MFVVYALLCSCASSGDLVDPFFSFLMLENWLGPSLGCECLFVEFLCSMERFGYSVLGKAKSY